MKKMIAALAAAAALSGLCGCASLFRNPNGVPPAPPVQDPGSFFITPTPTG